MFIIKLCCKYALDVSYLKFKGRLFYYSFIELCISYPDIFLYVCN